MNRCGHTVTRPPESGVGENQRRREKAAAEQLLRAVEIRKDAVQEMRALYQARLEFIPLRRRNQERDGIQIPRAVHSERIAIDIVGNAVFPNSLSGDLPAAGKFFVAERGHGTDEPIPVRTKNAWRGRHLVINAVRLAITDAQEKPIESISGSAHKGPTPRSSRTGDLPSSRTPQIQR